MNKRGRESNFDIPKCLTSNEVFECESCHRQFSSYQALGGHRASHHKRGRRMEAEGEKHKANTNSVGLELEVHECGICGKVFVKGQALGGHMRKHRASIYESFNPFSIVNEVFTRSPNSERIWSLDLNLTPLENDLKALFGEMAPKLS